MQKLEVMESGKNFRLSSICHSIVTIFCFLGRGVAEEALASLKLAVTILITAIMSLRKQCAILPKT